MPFQFGQPFPFRDNKGNPVVIVIEQHREGEKGGDWVDIPFNIKYLETHEVEHYYLRFTRSFVTTSGMLMPEEDSYAVEMMIRDIILSGEFSPVVNKIIEIHTTKVDSIIKGIITFDDNGRMWYEREPKMIIRENQMARKLLLQYAYLERSASFDRTRLLKSCHYDHNALEKALEYLVTAGFIRVVNAPTIYALTNKGQVEFENTYLRYSNSVFLIAACKDDVEETIKEVYKPVIEGEFGLKLIFQEREEPSKTIHEDIYDYIDNCKFIITDLTHHRPNCYYELGYARAKGKQIILCIEESEREEIPFDVTPLRYTPYNMSKKDNFIGELRDRVNIVQSRLGSI